MPYCTDRKEDILTCMNNYSCHTCPYWSSNVKNKNEINKEKERKVNKAPNKLTYTLNKAETCENYNYWCGKLAHIIDCEACKFYEIKTK